MGTHSKILFCRRYPSNCIENRIEKFLMIYQHFDGYLGGVGFVLAEFLKNIDYNRNGIRYEDQKQLGKMANGFECMVAQFIAKIKTEVGQVYIEPCESELDEEYNYIVIDCLISKKTFVKVFCNIGSDEKFLKKQPAEEMSVDEFYDLCKKATKE